MTITISQKISYERIADLLCNAFEGGSNYWCKIKKRIAPEVWQFEDAADLLKPGEHFNQSYPLNKTGSLVITDLEENVDYELCLADIETGLSIMAEKFPNHFADFLSENDDADTGDVFLQCCVFQDVIYG